MRSQRFALLAVVLSAALAAGCTKVSTQTRGAHEGNPWTTHGILRVADVAEPDTLNPLIGAQQAEIDLSMFWGSYLFRNDDRNQWVPELATEVPSLENGGISADGRAVTYHLRAGVKWHDGAPFGADDVIYTWQQVMNPNNNVGSRVGYDDVARIDKKDDYTIVVHLRRPYAPFVSTFFSGGGIVICILPKHLLSQYADLNRVSYNNHPIGTGPFMVERYEKGNMIKLVANPTYFRGPPRLKEIDWHFIPDSNTILTQLRTHEIDAWLASVYEYLPALKTLEGTRLYFTPLQAFSQIALNLRNPVLHDRIVRQALAYSVDRATIRNKVYHGVPILATTDQPAFLWAHNPGARRYDYDPQRAVRMLDADGWKLSGDGYRYKNGQRLQVQFLTFPQGNGSDNILITQDWQRIGVDATIKIVAGPIYFASFGAGGPVSRGNFDATYFGWLSGPDPDDSTLWTCDQIPPAGQNVYRFCNAELDAAEHVALNSYDQKTRQAAYYKIQQILSEEEPTIIMFNTRRISALNTDFKNFKPAHSVSLLWNTWEWEI